MAEAAQHWQVDRSVIMRIRTLAKPGAIEALANSRPGKQRTGRDWELELARADAAGGARCSRRWRSSSP